MIMPIEHTKLRSVFNKKYLKKKYVSKINVKYKLISMKKLSLKINSNSLKFEFINSIQGIELIINNRKTYAISLKYLL
tara:strand:+ start:1260 stop:1493 length:234 start_codon:yes stop_codon:yes gene_type:complete